jgi:rubredoxin
MFRKNYLVKVNLPGGIIPAGDLYAIVQAAEGARVEEVQLGTRQQLFFTVADRYGPGFLQELKQAGISFEANEEKYPNIVSSYVTEEVFQNAAWLSEGMYKDILDGFDFRPRLKINLVEGSQAFVPFFTGNINFISSDTANYWHLYIRYPRTNALYAWKELIYSRDIPRISRLIEEALLNEGALLLDRQSPDGNPYFADNGELLYEQVSRGEHFATQRIDAPLKLPPFNLPYYEGFNRYGNKLWLGIYRREELFPLAFLRDICLICLQTKIGQLYTTPWKSLIVKGIEPADRKLWDYTLGKYRINVRHASNELNWQVEDICEEGLRLKRYLVRQFDNDDIRTYGLCFAIKTRPRSGLFGSVIIRKQESVGYRQRKGLDRYDILYTRDFNANSKEHILFREGLEKENLGAYLISLCKYFYELQSEENLVSHNTYRGEKASGETDPVKEWVFQCRHCLSLYDEQYGDPPAEIQAGMKFEAIEEYACPVCGAPKQDFAAVEKSRLIH